MAAGPGGIARAPRGSPAVLMIAAVRPSCCFVGTSGKEGLGKLLPRPPARTRPPGSGPVYGARTVLVRVLELYFAGFGRYFPGNTV